MMSVFKNAIECLAVLNSSSLRDPYDAVFLEILPSWMFTMEYVPWLWAMIGSILVGLSGVLPLLIIHVDESDILKQGASANFLKTILAFAVGGLLGDVFLHSLPEIWEREITTKGHHGLGNGLLILTGLVVFVMAEKIFTVIGEMTEKSVATNNIPENNNIKGAVIPNKKHITGYLNLLANTIDNFTHGLSLGGAFLISWRSGLFTTFAILVHEVPHEVGDFAILLKSGFSRWDAAVFQLLTASGGLFGSLAALLFSGAANSIEARTSWILPFTAGSFLHIALVTVLPDLLKEEDPKESIKQLLALISGIGVMAFIAVFVE
ncbi:zinc transporter ZIP13 homolog [Coccinella septempunctata]|uniref:zinc transporter ZIP13 homolog n=1 Tax=Coccinella septempunctata TaxID=41139 RepID=UPI001D08EEA0|nr:zinc transporter ZIP13 homolog [Coccinella septempunctata]